MEHLPLICREPPRLRALKAVGRVQPLARCGRQTADAQALPVPPGNVGNADPKEQLGRMFLREQANPNQVPAPDAFISK